MSKFLDEGGVLPVEASDEEEDEEDEDEDEVDDAGDVSKVCVFINTLYVFPVNMNLLHSPFSSLLFHFSLFQETDESEEGPTNTTSKDEL